MPDIGGMRRRLTEQAKQAAQHATQRVEQLSANVAPPSEQGSADAESDASAADVADEINRLRNFLASRRPPPGPVRGRWSIGIGDLLAAHPRVPSAAKGLVRNLDRYGGLAITERTLEFDHDAIEWSSVTEVRTRNVVEYLLSDGLAQQIESLPLPWFPGRRRVLDALSKALLTLVVTVAREQLDRHADIRIPAEVAYRGAVRRNRQLTPGILAALVMADPAVNQCFHATASAHGIPVLPADDDVLSTAGQRAEELRAKLGSLESALGRVPRTVTDSAVPSASGVAADGSGAAPSAAARPTELTFDLPDQGNVLIRLAQEAAGASGAAVIESAVADVRRPDGVLTFADVRASKNFMKGPAHTLAALLNLEAMAVGVWASGQVGMMQRRSVNKQVEQICKDNGVLAGVQWAMANVKVGPRDIDLLRDSLAGVPDGMPGGEDFVRTELVRSLRKRR